jgi:uridine kinase
MELKAAIDAIMAKRAELPGDRAVLVGISGIDGSGKGFISGKLSDELTKRGSPVAVTNADGWLNLPSVRFDATDPAGNFYRNAIRLDEMFESLILPLRDRRSIRAEADLTEETAVEYRRHAYDFRDIDVLLLEGIFLFKKQYVDHFDLRIWIECPFETALERAVARSQEGLPPDETIAAYETIYFPAQRLHFRLDDPAASADVVLRNYGPK